MRKLLLAALVAAAPAAQAFTVGAIPQIGLAGYGVLGQVAVSPYLAFSSGYTQGTYNIDKVRTQDGSTTYTYSGDLNLRNTQFLVNIAPSGGNFRISAGIFKLNDNFSLEGTRTDGNVQTGTATAKGKYGNQVAPALLIGFESPLQQRGLGYHFSIGAVYAGKPDVRVDAQCTFQSSACNAEAQRQEKNLEKELSKYEVLPVLQAGLVFRL